MAAKKAKTCRIEIQNKLPNILKAEVTGLEFHGPYWFSGFEDYYNPRLREIRRKYRIDGAVRGETNEWRKILKLRNWVKSRWHVDNGQSRGGDAFDILELAKQGHGFHCSPAPPSRMPCFPPTESSHVRLPQIVAGMTTAGASTTESMKSGRTISRSGSSSTRSSTTTSKRPAFHSLRRRPTKPCARTVAGASRCGRA